MPTDATEINKKPDGTAVFELVIPKDTVASEYEKVLTDATKNTEVSGFRKGKAPTNLVEEKVGKQQLYTTVLKRVLPEAYLKEVNRLNLKPIASPKIEPQKIEEGQDWTLTVTLAEKPPFTLGNYRKVVSGALATAKIWVPGKDQPSPEQPGSTQPKNAPSQPSTDEKLAKIFQALLSAISIPVPEILIEDELNHSLTHLIEQLQRLDLSLDQYLTSLGKTSDQLRTEYRTRAEEEIKLELILNEIAIDLQITITKEEIDELIKAVGDEKLRERLSTEDQRRTIGASLKKRKVVDALLKM
ncbi:MAG: hypothetical protein A2900_04310 [Candidatus Chisholmbacteria bacterium RIFCSPLOWO2_01_FULL_50_28]|uniref:Trigger factor n=1 Tax=Candidatus Chisholmbacteria bacterium RIFCSPHIGHO2_01_FULL_52_32 TaxID=1797591 RepID=A0A1G1VSG8_9BACT|nr:MAG: hypothetical protein A2786_02435 [Candidatus Chisholmbacteria bacterium RIFCSPHIGHO2_01_FULL_52_32]OGY20278.1 MAG: hypothetical protein A2900_04310 [Candidatus Chisholmbacteria bacterium RIFCSPLOWO2_01_FULL_50_28]